MFEIDRIWLQKAEENFASAESEFVNKRYNSCANRCYYACFQAAIFALRKAGVRAQGSSRQWGHDRVQADFIGDLVNRRRLYPPVLRPTLSQTYALRVTADYTPDHVTEVRASRAVARAAAFVGAIRDGGGNDR